MNHTACTMVKDSIIPYSIIGSLAKIENVYELRLFGWILAKAQSVLKLYNKNLAEINLQYALDVAQITMPARYLLVEGDRNYKNIRKAFTLAQKTVEYERNGTEYHLNIIAFPQLLKARKEVMFRCVIHNELWHALLNFSKGYRLVNLQTYMALKSNYSVIMYMIISQQSEQMNYNIARLKKILGVDGMKAYERNNNFLQKVIERAMSELDEHSPYTFRYGLYRAGRGGGYKEIIIRPQVNASYKPAGSEAVAKEINKQRVRLDEKVVFYLEDTFQMSPQGMEQIEGLLLQIGDTEAQLDYLSMIKEYTNKSRIGNPAGYLVESLRHRK